MSFSHPCLVSALITGPSLTPNEVMHKPLPLVVVVSIHDTSIHA